MIGGAGGKAVMALLLAILPLHVSHRNWAYVVHVIVTIQTLVVTLFLPHNFRSAIWILRCCGDGRRVVTRQTTLTLHMHRMSSLAEERPVG